MPSEKVLIVEDEENARTGLAELISAWGYRTETARDGIEGLEKVVSWSPKIVISDLKMPRMDGIQLLERIAEQPQAVTVVLLTAQGSIDTAVEAMKLGAYDFLTKPVDAQRLKVILTNAVRLHTAQHEVAVSRRNLRNAGVLGQLVGTSKVMQEMFVLVEQVAPSTASVLITGESGSGKEMLARTLHELSPRKDKPFVAINCAAIPETLIESEIFGHEKGSFTGAVERRIGCFELAAGGTLLLDELAEMPVGTQAKLLRVLEERKLRRLGARNEIDVDVRVLAATNREPEDAIENGKLRSDLFYRLNVFHIHMPPLRTHLEDLPAMAEAMLDEMNQKHSKKVSGVAPSILDRMIAYHWPGNARELRNTIERAVILCPDGMPLDAGHLPPNFGKAQPLAPPVDADRSDCSECLWAPASAASRSRVRTVMSSSCPKALALSAMDAAEEFASTAVRSKPKSSPSGLRASTTPSVMRVSRSLGRRA